MRSLILSWLLPLSLLATTPPASSPSSAPSGRVIIGKSSISVTEPMIFEENSEVLTPSIVASLDLIAQTLIDNPELTLVEIQGHADPSTEKRMAKELANKRARAAKSYLTGKGVSPKRIRAKGYAATRPLSTTEAAPNRRIEVHIKKNK